MTVLSLTNNKLKQFTEHNDDKIVLVKSIILYLYIKC